MNPALLVFLRHLVVRRWSLHVLVVAVYAFAMFGTAYGFATVSMYTLAAVVGMFRVDEGAVLTTRSARLLPLSNRHCRQLLWVWIFMAPLVAMALSLFATWIASGFATDDAIQRCGLIAMYVVAPFALTLLASSLPRTRANGAIRLIAVMAYFMAVVGNFTQPQPSPTLLAITIALIACGVTYPLWGRLVFGSDTARKHHADAALGLSWPTGVTAMIWSRVRAATPSILVAGAFVLVLVLTMTKRGMPLQRFVAMLAIVLMAYIWMSNWRWLCHFRVMRCLPLSARQLTALTIGVSFVPTVTVWVAQLAISLPLFGTSALPVTSLLALLAAQAITVPVFLYSPGWLRQSTLAALLPTVFLVIQGSAAASGLETVQTWILSVSRVWLVAFIAALIACIVVAVAWTYREITQGRHAYRVQTDDWAPPSWVWVD